MEILIRYVAEPKEFLQIPIFSISESQILRLGFVTLEDCKTAEKLFMNKLDGEFTSV